MAFKQFIIDGQTVTIYKRQGNRHLRLTIAPDGMVRVSIPTWAPYNAGLQFVRSKQAWIQRQHRAPLLTSGQAIGKAHHLHFLPAEGLSKATSRVQTTEIMVRHPVRLDTSHSDVQKVARMAAVRALRQQAERLLPTRLATLAAQYNFQYQAVSVKQLKSRWGSCDHQGNITLNLFLMQLPWDQIDYVLLHELVHTRVLQHGPDFWRTLEAILPDAKAKRVAIRAYQPILS